MAIQTDCFAFGEPASFMRPGDFVALLPAGIHDKYLLLTSLQRVLELPKYFGMNWDALSDLLRDLHWRSERRIVLVHADVPQLGDQTATYLEILCDAARDWRRDEAHELIVIFPTEAQDVISSLRVAAP